ncbi:glycosyltransferase [Maritimibacter sp. HL-12]|uniref:glycosyltransferase n=1 Tax=Maritimibacter sp. HL-12 TaxID=1162418 RepID=UPI0020CB128F|nr:glycosyltransferase [Maritimibacter sp. HL-12]
MAAYNSQTTIGDSVEFFPSQDRLDMELIVIDGASEDGTCAIVEGFNSPTIRFCSQSDQGIYDAQNKGMALVDGEMTGLSHTDDLFARQSVLAQVAKAFGSGNIDGVYGDLEYVARDCPGRASLDWRVGACSPKPLRKDWMPPHPLLFLRRDVFEKHGSYEIGFRVATDFEAIRRWLTKGKLRLAYSPVVLFRIRVGDESYRSLGWVICKSREVLRAFRRYSIGGRGFCWPRTSASYVNSQVGKVPRI